MEVLQYSIRKVIAGIPLVLGVTFISFLLIVYFGPDQTYELLGKNPTTEEIAEVRSQLGYDQPFATRYLQYLREIVTLDFGSSQSTDEKVRLCVRKSSGRDPRIAGRLSSRAVAGQIHYGICCGRHVDQFSDSYYWLSDSIVLQ